MAPTVYITQTWLYSLEPMTIDEGGAIGLQVNAMHGQFEGLVLSIMVMQFNCPCAMLTLPDEFNVA